MKYLLIKLGVLLGYHQAACRGKDFYGFASRKGKVVLYWPNLLVLTVWGCDPSKMRILSIATSIKAHTVCILVKDLISNKLRVVRTDAPYGEGHVHEIDLSPIVASQRRGRLVRTLKGIVLVVPQEGAQLMLEL